MHDITELPAWERLFKKNVWEQLGDLEGKKILDFGSGEGITANHFAEKNDITKWEPRITISDIWGIRTFGDLQQNQQKHGDEEWQEKMLQLELRVSQMREYRNIAFFHHLLLKKIETALNEI